MSAFQNPGPLLLKPGPQLGLPHCTGPSCTRPHQPWSPKAMAIAVDAGRLAPASEAPGDRQGWIRGATAFHTEELKCKALDLEAAVRSRDTARPAGRHGVCVLASESGQLSSDNIRILQADGSDSETSRQGKKVIPTLTSGSHHHVPVTGRGRSQASCSGGNGGCGGGSRCNLDFGLKAEKEGTAPLHDFCPWSPRVPCP